jgi:chromosome segregation ATPase
MSTNASRDFSKLIKITGKYNFNFNFYTQTNYVYLASNLVAEAIDKSTNLPVAMKYKWQRIRGNRIYNMNTIHGNVYQLSAEDVGCKIRVEAEPLDDEVYEGKVLAEFGPVTVEPSARQSLEYILGSGGSRFPVTIYYPEDRHKMIDERKFREGTLIINNKTIRLEEKHDFAGKRKEVFSCKYTIDHPKIDITSNDTKMLTIDYYDDDDVYGSEKGLNFSLDLRALSRQSRDLIALSIRCFSALNYFKHSKVISALNKEDDIDDSPSKKKKEKDTITELLMELDFIKRELYEQIGINKEVEVERNNAKKQFLDLESEMEQTLEGYRIVLEDTEHSPEDTQMRNEMRNQLKLNDTLQKEKNQLAEENMVLVDEKKTLNKKVKDKEELLEIMKGEIFELKKGKVIPLHEHEKIKKEKEKCRKDAKKFAEEIRVLEKKLLSMKSDTNGVTKDKNQLETEKKQLSSYLKHQEEQAEELKAKLEEVEKENRQLQRKAVPEADIGAETSKLRDENEALISQRNAMTKQKDSLMKELEKRNKELDKFRNEAEGSVSRLTQSNKRFLDEQKDLEGKIEELEEKNDRLLEDKNEIIFKQKEEIETIKAKLSEKSSVANKFKDLFSKKKAEEESKCVVKDTEIQTDEVMFADEMPRMEESPSKIGMGLRKYSKTIKNSFMESSRNSVLDESVQNVKELDDLKRRIKKLEKEKMAFGMEKKDSEECNQDLRRMIERKDDQLEEMRVEIERLAMKLCAAESKLFEHS